MKKAVIYIHGMGGNAKEAKYYQKFFSEEEVLGLDYKSQFPWEAKVEFPKFLDALASRYGEISLIANSIGAYYSMLSLGDHLLKHAMFISPIADMETLILNRMAEMRVSEEELYQKKVIETSLGAPLSWEYLSYVRTHPIRWKVPTDILCAENDPMTPLETMTDFAKKIGATITVMKHGEHWFHTEEQMLFLDHWFRTRIRRIGKERNIENEGHRKVPSRKRAETTDAPANDAEIRRKKWIDRHF